MKRACHVIGKQHPSLLSGLRATCRRSTRALGGRNITNRARAGSEEPEIFAIRSTREGPRAVHQLATVSPVRYESNTGKAALLGALNDSQFRHGQWHIASERPNR